MRSPVSLLADSVDQSQPLLRSNGRNTEATPSTSAFGKRAVHVDEEEYSASLSTEEKRVGKNGFPSLTKKRSRENDDFKEEFSLDSPPKVTTFSSFCGSMKPQIRIFLYCSALLSITFLLYVTLLRDSALDDKTGHRGKGSVKNVFTKRPPSKTVKIEIYMESQCPDTTKFIDSQLTPTFNELEDYIDLKIIPFGKAKWTRLPGEDEDYSLQCQHGPNECSVNQLMCCGMERLKTANKYLPYVACLQGTPPGGREQATCSHSAGLNHKDVEECADGREGRLLHKKMGVLTKALQPSATFIPWTMVDGVREKRALVELKAIVCEKIQKYDIKPKACEAVLSVH